VYRFVLIIRIMDRSFFYNPRLITKQFFIQIIDCLLDLTDIGSNKIFLAFSFLTK
jgi:hypothetical protein